MIIWAQEDIWPGKYLVKMVEGKETCTKETLSQQSPTFLPLGTSSVEDNFSTDWGVWRGGDDLGMIQTHYI